MLFPRQTVDSIVAAVERLDTERHSISADACRENAARFSVERFRQSVEDALDEAMEKHRLS
jgi:mannitol-1-phosphate/altronate dehydrogenase